MKTLLPTKRIFDCESINDLNMYSSYLRLGQWKTGCPFIEEWPYTTVPDTIQNKLIAFYLPKIIKQLDK